MPCIYTHRGNSVSHHLSGPNLWMYSWPLTTFVSNCNKRNAADTWKSDILNLWHAGCDSVPLFHTGSESSTIRTCNNPVSSHVGGGQEIALAQETESVLCLVKHKKGLCTLGGEGLVLLVACLQLCTKVLFTLYKHWKTSLWPGFEHLTWHLSALGNTSNRTDGWSRWGVCGIGWHVYICAPCSASVAYWPPCYHSYLLSFSAPISAS